MRQIVFTTRLKQRYCSPACRNTAWRKANKSVATADGASTPEKRCKGCSPANAALSAYVWAYPPRGMEVPLSGPTPGALQGDDVRLGYYPDGYPKLPACLDRRRSNLAVAA